MQGIYTQTPSANTITELIPSVATGNVITVITTVVTTVTNAKVELMIYSGNTLVHTIVFNPPENETIFIDSKIFLTDGYLLKVRSDQSDSTISVMVDDSKNI